MPFLTFVCKNPTPHKTVVFVPAANLGSNSPGAGGGNFGGVFPATAGGTAAIITCPKCAFTSQAGDGQMSSVSNGTDTIRQEESLTVAGAGQAPPSGQPAPVTGVADSGVRIPINSPGNMAGGNQQAAGSSAYRLDSAGQKNLN
jgi:hypothetical protein